MLSNCFFGETSKDIKGYQLVRYKKNHRTTFEALSGCIKCPLSKIPEHNKYGRNEQGY